MPDQGSVATIRAAVDVVVPPADGVPGGAELGVERHVCDLIEKAFPGFVDLIAALLDAYASDVSPGTPFAELDEAGRNAVLRAMSTDESQDVRDAADAIFVFSFGGAYSEWTGFDRERRRLVPPAVWARAGYHGPVFGHPDYREDDA